MKIYLDNIGIIKESEILVDGLTIVAGENSSGKSTIGKSLYAVYNAIENIEIRNQNDKVNYARNVAGQIIYSGEMAYLFNHLRYGDLNKARQSGLVDLIGSPLPKFVTVEEAEQFLIRLKNDISSLNDSLDTLTNNQRVQVARQMIKRLQDTSLPRIDSVLALFKMDQNMTQYTGDWIAKSLGAEMCSQIQPIKYHDIRSTLTIEDNVPQFVNLVIEEGNKYKVSCKRDMKSIKKVFLLDNILDLDLAYSSVREKQSVSINKSTEELPAEYYNFMNSRSALKHNNKNRIILSSLGNLSVIEEKVYAEKTKHILELLDEIIPGHFSSREDGMYYAENQSELNAANLASGSKLLAMIKILLVRGDLDEGTLLILDEPECHLHPEWQRKLAEIVCLMIKDLGVKVVITTHNPNFLLALDTFSLKHNIRTKTHIYQSFKDKDNYMSIFKAVDKNIESIYASMSKPFLELDAQRRSIMLGDDDNE